MKRYYFIMELYESEVLRLKAVVSKSTTVLKYIARQSCCFQQQLCLHVTMLILDRLMRLKLIFDLVYVA